MEKEICERIVLQYDLLLAALLLNRFRPMASHHVAAISERLGYKTDDELRKFICTGKRQEVQITKKVISITALAKWLDDNQYRLHDDLWKSPIHSREYTASIFQWCGTSRAKWWMPEEWIEGIDH